MGASDVALRGPVGLWWQRGTSAYRRYGLQADVRHVSLHDGALTDAQMRTALAAHSSSEPICSALQPSGALSAWHVCPLPLRAVLRLPASAGRAAAGCSLRLV